MLTVDSNGIGYLNEWTFRKTYSRPIVKQLNGENVDEYLIGFNPSAFFGKGSICCYEKREIQNLSFKIGTKPHLEDEYFEHKSLMELVDKNKVKWTEIEKYTNFSDTTIQLLE